MAGDAVSKFPNECFFIAPIGSDDSDIRRRSDGVMNFIVKPAAEEFHLNVVRADQIATPGQINLQVIEHVIGARAAVADLTGLNPNVFYEMAVRHTAKLPLVIVAEKGTDLPFDIAQMRTIFFDHKDLGDADKCRQSIIAHLREALDNNVVDSPISSAVDLSFLSAGSAADRSIAELVTTVEALARGQRDLADRVEVLPRFLADRGLRDDSVPIALIRDLEEASGLLDGLAADDLAAKDAVERIRFASEYLRDRHAGRRHSSTSASSKGPRSAGAVFSDDKAKSS